MTEQPGFLPYGRQQIDEDDVEAVARVLRGDWLTTGPTVAEFETAFACAVSAPYAVSCSSGTAALHLAMLALGLGPGERAVVPAITFVATANAVRYVGGEVVFADVDPETGLMRPEDLEAALARAGAAEGGPVKAALPVWMAGQTGDPAGLATVAARHRIAIVEDACHAIGSRYLRDNEPAAVGECRDSAMAAFSFHPVKTVAMGEGGAVTTRDPALAARLAELRNHGLVRSPDRFVDRALALDAEGRPNPWYYELHEPGFNYRATDIQCALGLSQLGKLARFLARRRELVERYDRLLGELSPVVRPLARTPGAEPGWHLYVALIDFPALGLDRAAVVARLREAGIGSQVHYIPVHRQPYYRARYGAVDLPGADAYYARCLSLPLYPAMTDGDVDRVVEALAGIVRTGAGGR